MKDRALEEENRVIEELARPDVLGMSDPLPPKDQLGVWRCEVLLRLLDKRYRAMRPTWLSANLRSIGDADVAFTAAVWDRLQHESVVLFCSWGSYREPKRWQPANRTAGQAR
jgi:hypothetical protein